MTSRRSFLQQSVILAGGTILAPSCMASAAHSSAKKPCGIQLYTLRDFVGKDLKGTLDKIAAAGYTDVETFGWAPGNTFFGKTPAEFSALIKNAGLKTTSGHYLPENFLFKKGSADEWKQIAEAAATLGQEYTTVPWIPDQFRTPEIYKAMAEKLNEAAEISKKAGIKVAYHNHDFEFAPVGDAFGLDYLLKNTSPDLVDFELDIYWAVVAKKDPIDLFKQYKGRFAMWHVKDMHREVPAKNTEVGSGSIDYKAIFKHASTSGLKHFYVEQENFDMEAFASIKKSYDYIKTLKLG